MMCIKCYLLSEMFGQIEGSTNRDYWLMTELFMSLHDGRDWCSNGFDISKRDDYDYNLLKDYKTCDRCQENWVLTGKGLCDTCKSLANTSTR